MSIETSEPDIVYHYTTMDAMLKIVESRSIWASSLDYLNDTSEGNHFLGLVRHRLPDYAKEHGIAKEIVDIFLTEEEGRTFRSRAFVASFSEEGDSLPQWRSYCPKGNGIAIGFSVDCLKRAQFADVENGSMKNYAVNFAAVQYLKDSYPNSDLVIDAEIA